MIDRDTAVEVTRVLNRYFRLLDEKDFDASRLSDVFAPDGMVHRPNGTLMTGPAEIAASHRAGFARFAATQHLLTGHDVESEGDNVSVRANLVAVHLWGENPHGVIAAPEDVFVAGAVITASMVDTPGGLRISRLVNTNIWKTGSGFGSMAATLGSP